MGAPIDLMNIYLIPTWGLLAFGVALLGGLVAALVIARSRRMPVWTLGLVPVAGVAAFAAATAPDTMVTLSVALTSLGLALVMMVTGTFALAPVETGEQSSAGE